jgi:hypothetical protein
MIREIRPILHLAALPFMAAICLASADEKSSGDFAPVAPPEALARVLRINFDQVERWCDDNDLASAAKASQTAVVLATFLARRAGDKANPQADKLLAECNAFVSAARAKDMARTRSKLAVAGSTLPLLIQALPKEKPSWTNFKPSGSTGAWMILLDAGYADAKAADKAEDFEALAFTLAEEANVVAFLKKEPRWSQMAFRVRDTALAAAKESRQDLTKARKTLRAIYPRCETCHRAYQR